MIEPLLKLHTGRLLLTPKDAGQSPETAVVQALLADIGLIGEPLPAVPGGFAAGPRLLELIAFTGCAVKVDTNGGGDGGFLHVRIDGPLPRPTLKHGRNSRSPRCPACRSALTDWRDQLRRQGPEGPLRCPACGCSRPPADWDWRRHAGCGRMFVSVEEVFPGEAQPLAELMAQLADLGSGPWRYFYVQD